MFKKCTHSDILLSKMQCYQPLFKSLNKLVIQEEVLPAIVKLNGSESYKKQGDQMQFFSIKRLW